MRLLQPSIEDITAPQQSLPACRIASTRSPWLVAISVGFQTLQPVHHASGNLDGSVDHSFNEACAVFCSSSYLLIFGANSFFQRRINLALQLSLPCRSLVCCHPRMKRCADSTLSSISNLAASRCTASRVRPLRGRDPSKSSKHSPGPNRLLDAPMRVHTTTLSIKRVAALNARCVPPETARHVFLLLLLCSLYILQHPRPVPSKCCLPLTNLGNPLLCANTSTANPPPLETPSGGTASASPVWLWPDLELLPETPEGLPPEWRPISGRVSYCIPMFVYVHALAVEHLAG